jgi:hypothetical protein
MKSSGRWGEEEEVVGREREREYAGVHTTCC